MTSKRWPSWWYG